MVYLLIFLEAGEGVVEDCHEVHRVIAQALEVFGDTLWSHTKWKQSLLGSVYSMQWFHFWLRFESCFSNFGLKTQTILDLFPFDRDDAKQSMALMCLQL